VSNLKERRMRIMVTYRKPAVISLGAASSAIQGAHDKNINLVADANPNDATRTSGMAYDLDEYASGGAGTFNRMCPCHPDHQIVRPNLSSVILVERKSSLLCSVDTAATIP
jgi:hypothetical protein